jgi:hypothetical protein
MVGQRHWSSELLQRLNDESERPVEFAADFRCRLVVGPSPTFAGHTAHQDVLFQLFAIGSSTFVGTDALLI